MRSIRVRKVQAVYHLEIAVNDLLVDLERQNKKIKSIQFVDECVAFVVYETDSDLTEFNKVEVSG
ncbi:hypothetical protein HZY83_07500 [Gemella sp. GH3]|uniref:hypothetical protein n=1 Tax=unclassified Gemella TaxID=2624949 RepID=UPI0015D02201|nr:MULTISPECIES: hypothetical protein [unclassified Gemella]MBF0714519.1 hypothetical protein [Gemella sp. GH3.1]NYS51471.1 hypothetical protein [Gemella sp. GH3]